jgi:hypothetical protein
MKKRTSKLSSVALVAIGCALSLLAGCAEMASSNTKSLLSAAGFRVRTPETPKQKEIYASLEAYKMARATVPGKGVFYIYKDEKAGVAYVGREPEYQRYRQLCVQQRIAQEQYMAAEMERDMAMRWYGGWGWSRF